MSEIEYDKKNSKFINYLRGASILRVVLVHLGLSWIFLPYSSYVGIFLPVLFFCSGYVFLSLYRKSILATKYLYARLLGILIPFYLVYGVAVLISVLIGANEIPAFPEILKILIIAPSDEYMPYPLGQIWYLRVLLFCTLLSVFIFYAAQKNSLFLLLPAFVAAVLSVIQSYEPIAKSLSFVGHNFYQSILYGAYFFIGSYFLTFDWRKYRKTIFFISAANLGVAVLFFIYGSLSSANLSAYAYAPNLFFFCLGVLGILICLLLVEQIEWILEKVSIVRAVLLYCSQHSYGIYLIHSFLIVFSEFYFGWVSISASPLIALSKIAFVVFGSMVLAYPITYLSKFIINAFRMKNSTISEKGAAS
jgi:peptidoglycan/LPS O-acetylase OafA/YrhL